MLEIRGEKWIVTYVIDGKKGMGYCNSYQSLSTLISHIRTAGGKNIEIKDGTMFFVEDILE